MITAKADNRRRVQIPNIKAGQVFAIENDGSGVIVLHEVRPVEPGPGKCKLVEDEEGVLVMENERVITTADVQNALTEEFP